MADAAMVRVGRIVLRADGGFTPQSLPRHTYAPISFRGHANVESTDSQPVPCAAQFQARIRQGRAARYQGPAGLPARQPRRDHDPEPRRGSAARRWSAPARSRHRSPIRACSGVMLRSPLSLFNGPRINGNATVIAHARQLLPTPQTYVVVITIERLKKGPFSYRASAERPRIRRRNRGADPPRSRNRPPLQSRRRRTQLRLRPMQRQHLRDPRPVRIRGPRSDGDRRQRLQGLPAARPRRQPLPILAPPGPLAQLVEQETLNLKVVGSIPTRPTLDERRVPPETA